jgi:hypothetical protein
MAESLVAEDHYGRLGQGRTGGLLLGRDQDPIAGKWVVSWEHVDLSTGLLPL